MMHGHKRQSTTGGEPRTAKRRGTGWVCLAGSVLLWAAFAPLGWWPLAWIAPAFWIHLLVRPAPLERGAWRWIWAGSFVHGLGLNYYVTLPHPAGIAGWLAMSGYLSIYLPLFVWAGRALHHTVRLPIPLAAPIAWVASEWLRAHVISGYGMAMLPHAMYAHPLWIQTADWFGGYGTSAVMIAAAALLERGVRRRQARSLVGAVLIAAALAGYGAWRLARPERHDSDPVAVAVIQGSRDVRFGLSREEQWAEWRAVVREYRDLTLAARRRWPDLQLILWPESAFPQADLIAADGLQGLSDELRQAWRDARDAARFHWLAGIGGVPLPDDPPISDSNESLGPIPLLTGGHSLDLRTNREYNAALFFDTLGQVALRYHKMHLVMFGEYVPLGELFPIVYRWTPIPGALAPGTRPEAVEVGGVWFAPSICFESTVAHLIRRQVHELRRDGREPDCLVNLTNDGWFYGTNCLDLHLACNVFRAVELRRPMLVAANTGFSAHIDSRGRLIRVGPRRAPAVLRAEVTRQPRFSLYFWVGDLPAIALTLMAAAAVALERLKQFRAGPLKPRV